MNNFYKNYLNEFLSRFFITVLAWFNCIITSCIYKETLVYIYIKPSIFLYKEKPLYFIYSNLNELFYTYFNIIIITVNNIIVFFFFLQLLIFIAPGLRLYEYKFVKNLYCLSIMSYFSTLSLNYKIILPFSWDFFLNFQNNLDKHIQTDFFFEANLNKYIELIYKIMSICNYNVFTIITISLVTYYYNYDVIYYLKKFKKIIYLIILIVSSIITPPDVISQISVGIINTINFEIFVYLLLIQKNSFKATN